MRLFQRLPVCVSPDKRDLLYFVHPQTQSIFDVACKMYIPERCICLVRYENLAVLMLMQVAPGRDRSRCVESTESVAGASLATSGPSGSGV